METERVTKNSRRELGVKRITVDERLAEDLIRFEICALNKNVEKFFDRVGIWGEKKEELVRRTDYKRMLHLPQPWNTLKEGQVFMLGEFEIIGERTKPKYFKASPGKKEFIRIDDLRKFRDKTKRTYSDLLARR
jgi:hypothetical protein